MCTMGPPCSLWNEEKLRVFLDGSSCLSARNISSWAADDAMRPKAE